MTRTLAALASIALLSLASCGKAPAASLGGFHSPDPAARLYAIQYAGEKRDRTSIPYLIESLDSDDPAERMWAIQALEKITGQRKGYNPHALVLDREQAVARWQQAYENGELNTPPQQPPPRDMSQADQEHISLRIISHPRYLCAVRAMLDAVCERLGFDDATRGRMILAVDEAVTNIMRHGYQGADDQPIWLRLTPLDDDGGLRIVIEDECPQIDPAKMAGRALDDVRPGGLGVHIIKQVMDEVIIEPRDGDRGMRIAMTKKRMTTPVGK